jgi:hypothetical protein
MSKKCQFCGRFMTLTDLMPQDDVLDEELALSHGFTQHELDTLDPFESPLSKYIYVQDQWECDNCQTTEWHTEGKKYYWNDASGNYDADAPISPTEKQRIEREQERQRAIDAGQMELPLPASSEGQSA